MDIYTFDWFLESLVVYLNSRSILNLFKSVTIEEQKEIMETN